jgi:hypothetical protein
VTVSALYVPQTGRVKSLDAWLLDATRAPWHAHLYVNNQPYLPTRVIGDYTEASFTGYALQNIIWTFAAINLAGKAESSGGTISFTFTGSTGTFTIFGIYLTDALDSVLLAVIPFLAPIVVSPSNRTVAYALRLTDTSEL